MCHVNEHYISICITICMLIHKIAQYLAQYQVCPGALIRFSDTEKVIKEYNYCHIQLIRDALLIIPWVFYLP